VKIKDSRLTTREGESLDRCEHRTVLTIRSSLALRDLAKRMQDVVKIMKVVRKRR
jgi:hypothetical protein